MRGQQQTKTWQVGRRIYTAPEYWLAGRAGAHERDGMSPPQAYHQAMMDWETQEDLARAAGKA